MKRHLLDPGRLGEGESADGITDVYPEFNTDDPAETLFDYLETDYHRIPSADETNYCSWYA